MLDDKQHIREKDKGKAVLHCSRNGILKNLLDKNHLKVKLIEENAS